ncbi:MAG TPA: hypothetical protein VIU46_06675 [Gallionellaceae bacterium]
MSTMKHVISLLFLLPATCLAAETQPASGNNATAASSPAQSSLSVPLFVSDLHCDMVARFNAISWYTATLCSRRHQDMRAQEDKIKHLITRTYPGLHRAITMPPYSAAARETMDNSPYLPDSNPMFDEKSCKLNFDRMMMSIKDAETRRTILQCWEQPPSVANDTSPAPLNDKVCVGTAQYMASAWYKAGMCTALHKGLAMREAKIKEQIAATYPEFQKAISTPPLLDAGKYMATYSSSVFGNDPTLTEEGCAANLDFLAAPLNGTDWTDTVEQCWGKPRPVAQGMPPASQ